MNPKPFVFTYNGIPSSEYGIYASEGDAFNPQKRQSRRKIDFRHGTYDFEGAMYDNRLLELHCFWKSPKTRHELREVTLWLSRSGEISFDVEPDKHYKASLYDSVSLDPFYNRFTHESHQGRFNLTFYCDPFARSEQTILQISAGYTDIDYKGTATTPTQIIIRNTGSTPLQGISVLEMGLF